MVAARTRLSEVAGPAGELLDRSTRCCGRRRSETPSSGWGRPCGGHPPWRRVLLVGYYSLLAVALKAFRIGTPAGVEDPLSEQPDGGR